MAGSVTPAAPSLGPVPPDAASAAPVRKPATDLRWYVIQHEAFRGAHARNRIRRAGFEAFWPRRVVERPRRDDVIEPLWPGYLLAQFSLAQAGWGRIAHLKPEVLGVLGIREAGAPLPMPHGLVEAMIAGCGGIDLPVNLTGPMAGHAAGWVKPGDAVGIAGGALADLRGLVVQDSGPARVQVLLQMLGVERVVEVDRKNVRKL